MQDDVRSTVEKYLKVVAGALGITSIWLLKFDFEKNTSLAVAEYVDFSANILEQSSDLGEEYPEVDSEFIEWLRLGDQKGYILHVDELDRDDPDWSEYIENGVDSAGYMQVIVNRHVWGYIEFWESRKKRDFTPDDFRIVMQASYAIADAITRAEKA